MKAPHELYGFVRLLLVLLMATVGPFRSQAQTSGSGGSGSWAFTYQCTGSYTVTHTDMYGNTTTATYPWNSTDTTYRLGSQNYGDQYASITFQGQIVTTATWQDSLGRPAPNPPATLKMRQIGYCDTTYADGNGSANDGLNDGAICGISEDTSSGAHTVILTVSGGTATVTNTVSASFVSNVTPASQGWATGFIQGYCYATLDNRGVSLTRQGAHGETVDSSGVTHGDTLYSLNVTSITAGQNDNTLVTSLTNSNFQNFAAAISGPWSSGSFESWNPSSSGDTLTTTSWLQSLGTMTETYFPDGDVSYNGIDMPQPRTLTYTLTDPTDSFSASASYVLTMHDPYETNQWNYAQTNGPWVNAPQIVQNPTNANMDVPGAYREIAEAFAISVTWNPEILADEFILGTLGLTIDFQYQVTANIGQQLPTITLPPNTYTQLQYADVFTHYWGTVNGFDTGGPTGLHNYDVSVPQGIVLRMMPPQAMSGSGTGPGGPTGGSGGGS